MGADFRFPSFRITSPSTFAIIFLTTNPQSTLHTQKPSSWYPPAHRSAPHPNADLPLQVQGHHGIPFATSKPAYGTYKSPYGPKYALPLLLLPFRTTAYKSTPQQMKMIDTEMLTTSRRSYKIQPNIRGIGPGRALKLYGDTLHANRPISSHLPPPGLSHQMSRNVPADENQQRHHTRQLRRRRRDIRAAILRRSAQGQE